MQQAVNDLIAAIEESIAQPTDGSVLGNVARRWLRGEGDRYFLRGDLRSLLFSVEAGAIEGQLVAPEVLAQWMFAAVDLRRRIAPERNPYFDPATARLRMIALGVYTETDAPPVDRFALTLDRLCDLIHQWLGRRLAVTTYTKTLTTDRWGRLRLPDWPVLGVERLSLQGTSATGQPLLLRPIRTYWSGLREIETGFRCHAVEVTYTAGLDPVPSAVTDCLIDLLLEAARQDPTLGAIDLPWFNNPYRDVESVRLPGGLEKTFAIPEGGGAAAVGKTQTQIDRLLYPLTKYRVSTVIC